MYPCTKFQSIWRTLDFETKFAQKNMTGKHFEKNKHHDCNKHIAMYPRTKFQ